MRTFRVGRVTSVTRTGQAALRPDGFDLEATWREIVANVDELRSPQRLDLTVAPELVRVLQWMFDKQAKVGDEQPDGRIAVSLGCQSVERCAAEIAGFGGRIEVTGPPEAREFLARLGHE